MTVPVQTTYTASIANGATTVFPYGFKIAAAEDLAVTVDGVRLSSGYTVSGVGNPSGGNVTITTPPADGAKVVRYLAPILKRETDYQQFGDWLAAVVNLDFDRIWLTLQTLQQNDIRSLKLPVDTAVDQVLIQDAAARANRTIKFDGDGNMTISTYDPDGAQTAAAASASAASASAAAASASATSASSSASTATTQASNASTSATNAATSASSASTSASNASTSATNAATSATAADSAAQAVSIKWAFDSSTTMADPGTGDLRLDNATVGSVTNIAVSALSSASGNPDLSDFIATWDDSTSSVKGTIILRKSGTPATFAVFSVTGTITDNSTWLQIPVTHVTSSGTWSAADVIYAAFSRTGTKGDTGAAGAGDMLAANNLSDVANAATAFGNIKQAASTSATGVIEIATLAEAITGTDTSRAVTAEGVAGQRQAQTGTAYTTGGSSTAFTLTPSPALSALAENQEFDVEFHTAAGSTPTLAISGLTAKSLKYRNSSGTLTAVTSTQIPSGWRSKVTYDGTDYIVREVPPAAAGGSGLTVSATVATTSGTAVTIGSIPAGTKQITVTLAGVSTSGTSNLLLQIGDAGGLETTGYLSTGATNGTTYADSTIGFILSGTVAAAETHNGSIILTLQDAATFMWVSQGAMNRSAGYLDTNGGKKALSAELTQISLTTVGGSDTFDAGLIGITYQ